MRCITSIIATTLSLIALTAGTAAAQELGAANPAYTACTEWVETLNFCTGSEHDATTGCGFAMALDPAEAAVYECWTDRAMDSAQGPGVCDLSATAACNDIVAEEEAADPEAAEAISRCAGAIEKVEGCMEANGSTPPADDPGLRCEMAWESGHLTVKTSQQLAARAQALECSNVEYMNRMIDHPKFPPTIDEMACVETCVAYHEAFNSCADAAGWSSDVEADDIADICRIGSTCGEHDYVGYYQCLADALPTDCAADDVELGSVYSCRID